MTAPVSFTCTDGQRQRLVLRLNGQSIALVTTSSLVTPATITRAQLAQLLANHTINDLDGDGDQRWTTTLPGLDDDVTVWHTHEGLEEDVAYKLNSYGISISDWPPYCLD
jgi:hypothetical protein